MMTKLEAYSDAHQGMLHPTLAWKCQTFFDQPFWGRSAFRVLEEVRIELVDSPSRLAAIGRGAPTPIWVQFGKIKLARGNLNTKGGNSQYAINLDLTTIDGFTTFLEEVYHVWQYRSMNFFQRAWYMFVHPILMSPFRKWHTTQAEIDAAEFIKRAKNRIKNEINYLGPFAALR